MELMNFKTCISSLQCIQCIFFFFETGFTIFFVPSLMLNVLLLNSPKFWENLTNPLLAGIQAEVEEVCFDNLCLFVSMCYAKVKMKSKLTIW